jgi:hypothetical protein
MMELKGEDYTVSFNSDNNTVEFSGSMRLRDSEEYQSLSDMLNEFQESITDNLILDFKNLKFMNSSGINTISKFVIKSRKADRINLIVYGNKDISWQQKSLANLQKLWSKVNVEIE